MNSYQLFSEPKKTFADVFEELKKAKKSIYIESHELKDDSVGRALIRILARKSLEVRVILIIDDYGYQKPSKTTKKLIENSKIEFLIFNPLRNALKEKHISKMSRFVMRSHRKLTIIDEKIAYVGGTNYTADELKWRDIFVKIKGTLVADLTRSFKEMLRLTNNRNILRQPVNKRLTKQFRGEDVVIRQVPHTRHRPFRKELNKLFAHAKKEIRITTPYFVPTVPFLYMMYKAIRRGVTIKILTPMKTDQYWVDITSDFFANLAHQRKAHVYFQHKMSHAKYIVFDKEVCTFGSSNFDYQTFHNNHEINIITKNKKIVNDLYHLFEEDCTQATRYSNLTRRNRNIIRKFFQWILHPFKKYF